MPARLTQEIAEAAQQPTNTQGRLSQVVAEVAVVQQPPTNARLTQYIAEAAQSTSSTQARLTQLCIEIAVVLRARGWPFTENGYTLASDRWM